MQADNSPEKYGPGTWHLLQAKAHRARTPKEKDEFIDLVNLAISSFRCEFCRKHATDYLEKHPIKDYYNVHDAQGRDIGMFKWIWEFHNTVNARLGKPYVDWDTAFGMYEQPSSTICFQGCGEDKVMSVHALAQVDPNSVRIITNNKYRR